MKKRIKRMMIRYIAKGRFPVASRFLGEDQLNLSHFIYTSSDETWLLFSRREVDI